MKNIIKQKKEKGFTLIEALISISILMISVVAPLSVASSSLIAAKIAEKQIVAAYLAQDAMEYVINKKAGYKIANYPQGLLKDDIPGSDDLEECSFKHGCYIDTIEDEITSCNNEDDCKEKIELTNGGYYSYRNGTKIDFSRVVKINRLKDSSGSPVEDEAKVEVTVYWSSDQGQEKSYTLTSNLTKW